MQAFEQKKGGCQLFWFMAFVRHQQGSTWSYALFPQSDSDVAKSMRLFSPSDSNNDVIIAKF